MKIRLWVMLSLYFFILFIFSLFFISKSNNLNDIYVHSKYGDAGISFDAHGVPCISATTKEAMIYAIGYLHAKDRLWSMHIMKFFYSGRLSEVAK